MALSESARSVAPQSEGLFFLFFFLETCFFCPHETWFSAKNCKEIEQVSEKIGKCQGPIAPCFVNLALFLHFKPVILVISKKECTVPHKEVTERVKLSLYIYLNYMFLDGWVVKMSKFYLRNVKTLSQLPEIS